MSLLKNQCEWLILCINCNYVCRLKKNISPYVLVGWRLRNRMMTVIKREYKDLVVSNMCCSVVKCLSPFTLTIYDRKILFWFLV